MWLGKWSPIVYKFSSNWKELRTLLLTMQQLKREHRQLVANTTIFYFTDNSTTYWIAASGSSKWDKLHSLITEIKLIEQDLQCSLQVIHVPGLLMIQQGTDSLSRGVWMSPLHQLVNQQDFTRAVFNPLPWCPMLVQQYVSYFCRDEKWYNHPWDCPWNANNCFNRLTVWFPPPELARQVITFMLETWVEKPLTTRLSFSFPVSYCLSGGDFHAIWSNLIVSDPISLPLIGLPSFQYQYWFYIYHGMFGNTLRIGWTQLPLPTLPDGTGNKPHTCVGCRLGYSQKMRQPLLRCHFHGTGFPFLNGTVSRPCHSTYHLTCFSTVYPFTTRRNGNARKVDLVPLHL